VRDYSHLLHPASYRKHVTHRARVSGHLASTILPPIFRVAFLRRKKGDPYYVNGMQKIIGDTIPPFRAVTIEVHQGKKEQSLHQKYYSSLCRSLAAPSGEDEEAGDDEGGRLNMGVHRRLTHMALDPNLETIVRKLGSKKTLADSVESWYTKDLDFGASFTFNILRPDSGYEPYAFRGQMARWLVHSSAKLQVAVGLVNHIVNVKKRRVLIFVDLPMVDNRVEMVLAMLGFVFCSLRASNLHNEREMIQLWWNDPGMHIEALVASLRTAQLGLNLQGACCDVVFIDVATSTNNWLQALSRVHRMGQTSAVNVWNITTDFSYDQVRQARCTNKYISQIAATAQFTDEELDFTEDPAVSSDENRFVRGKLVEKLAAETLVTMAGERCSREGWLDYQDLELKEFCPGGNNYDPDHGVNSKYYNIFL
jgi:hypothetical protein